MDIATDIMKIPVNQEYFKSFGVKMVEKNREELDAIYVDLVQHLRVMD